MVRRKKGVSRFSRTSLLALKRIRYGKTYQRANHTTVIEDSPKLRSISSLHIQVDHDNYLCVFVGGVPAKGAVGVVLVLVSVDVEVEVRVEY